jgi:hypothetical protein
VLVEKAATLVGVIAAAEQPRLFAPRTPLAGVHVPAVL